MTIENIIKTQVFGFIEDIKKPMLQQSILHGHAKSNHAQSNHAQSNHVLQKLQTTAKSITVNTYDDDHYIHKDTQFIFNKKLSVVAKIQNGKMQSLSFADIKLCKELKLEYNQSQDRYIDLKEKIENIF